MLVVNAVTVQRAIVAYAVVAMAVVGLSVALACILPLQARMETAAENAFAYSIDLQAEAVGESVARLRDLARQVTSRSAIRDALISYNRGQVPLEQLRAFSADKLVDSLKLSSEMIGISRLGPDGRELVTVGKPIPRPLWSPESGEPPALGVPSLINGAWVVVVSAPILNKDVGREGTDVLLFDAEVLRAHVADVHNLGQTGEVVLGVLGPGGAEVFFPRRSSGPAVDGEVVQAFAAATDGDATLRLKDAAGDDDTVVVKRLAGVDWIVMARQSVGELHRSIDQLVMMVGAGVVVLIAIGIGGFLLLLRPLTGRALVGTVELRQEMDERQRAQEALARALENTIAAVASTIEMRDPYTAGHQRRVAEIAVAIGRELGLDAERLKGLHVAGTIHDIGKIAIPTELLTRPGRIGPVEMDIIRCHSRDACDIIKDVEFPWPVADMIRHHHERMDGSGYPDGLKGDEIILEARILAVADVVEAIASDRPYRAALGLDAALNEITVYRGSLFDANVVDACRKLAADGRLPSTGVDDPPPFESWGIAENGEGGEDGRQPPSNAVGTLL